MQRPLVTPLPDLGVLRASGPDARRFLQGQLSNDMDRLDASPGLRAGLHTPQGRVIAILQLFPDAGDVLAVLPRELVADVAAHLGRYVLRSKLRLEDASARYAVHGVEDAAGRRLVVVPAGGPVPDGEPGSADDWRARDIAAGLPQVRTATRGAFVAQMLNLDQVEGISLTKGCYTGQEIIARAHYRGRVKRRLQRFATADPTPLAPGDRITLGDGRAADVVDVAVPRDGRREFLAVAALPGPAEDSAAPDPALPRFDTEALPLPYALDEPGPR
jgi:folate-binding protein YgfZ